MNRWFSGKRVKIAMNFGANIGRKGYERMMEIERSTDEDKGNEKKLDKSKE